MEKAKSVVFADYKGISTANQTKLRRQLLAQNAEMQVAKKTLMRIAAEKLGVEKLASSALEGQILVAFSYEDAITGAKVIKDMSKKVKELKLTGGIFENRPLNASDVQELADLPSKEVLVAKLLGTLLAPIQGFAQVGNGVIGGFVRVLNAHAENLSK